MTTLDTLICGDFNAHHPSWYSRSTTTRAHLFVNFALYKYLLMIIINSSDYGILNWDTPTIVPPNAEPSLPDVSLTSTSLIT